MIRDIETLRKALKGSKPLFGGIILWEGASLLDGSPVVAIANRIVAKSGNTKTGHMVQTFIIRSDMHPMQALQTGADAGICGDCKHRPTIVNGEYRKGSCYVEVAKSVASVYGAFTRGRYARAGIDFDAALIPALFEGLVFRLGSYGDPTAIPFMVWRRATLRVSGMAGYTHQWRNAKFAPFKTLCMASADSAAEMAEAHAVGWRTFRVRANEEPLFKGVEIMCPASAEAGFKTNCASCRACGGTSAKARVSIVIAAHGATASRFKLAA